MKEQGLQVRNAVGGDVDAMFDLFAEVQSIHAEAQPAFFRPPERGAAFRQYFEELLNDPQQRLVFACTDTTPIGYVQYILGQRPETIYHPARRFAYIQGLVVAKDHRGTGCGSQLIDHVKQEAKREGITMLGIDCWSFNNAARGCFQKAGFKLSKETMWLGL